MVPAVAAVVELAAAREEEVKQPALQTISSFQGGV